MVVRSGRRWGWRRLLGLAGLVVVGTGLVVAPMIVPALIDALVPRRVIHRSAIGFNWAVLGLFLTIVTVCPVGLIAAGLWIRRARRRGRPREGAARALLLCGSLLVGALLMECGAAASLAWSRRPPKVAVAFAAPDPSRPAPLDVGIPTAFAPAPDDALSLVVIGESSARGEPYADWLSVGHIVAWQLEQVLPGRRVHVDMRAHSGVHLEWAFGRLGGLSRRPDAVLVYAGHNEFQARVGWERNVDHYAKEKPRRPLGEVFLEAAARHSSLVTLVRRSIDRRTLYFPPPPRVTRTLVDQPAVSREEYATILADFKRTLEATLSYCEKVGALPIVIIPPANDGGFEPNRSVMSRSSGKGDREAFARDFRAARALEPSDPARAIGALRALVDRQPGFAEAHFRLARLLDRAGDYDGARRHYTMARDLDGLPLRCPSDFQDAFRDVAARRDVVLVDGPAVLRAASRRGILDDALFHDAHHPNLNGYVALAQDVLDRLQVRRAFGWPEGRPAPRVTPSMCAEHFRMDGPKWVKVFGRSERFYKMTAFIRHDPSERLEMARRYAVAAHRIAAGAPVEETGLVKLGD
jgi:hypothetical protein